MKNLKKFMCFFLSVVLLLPYIIQQNVKALETSDVFEFNGNYYKLFDEGVNWFDAKDACERIGGHLITINSEEENEFITSVLINSATRYCYWTAIMYDYELMNWVHYDGTTVEYQNWADNEPNDWKNKNEAFVHLYGKRFTGGIGIKEIGEWNDASSEGAGYAATIYELDQFGYVCEWEDSTQIELPNVSVVPGTKTEYNGHTYGIYTDKISWDEAVEFCESQGGHLATITSEAENNAITSLLSGENTAYWIGAEYTNGVWNWITDENWNYTNWGSGEPAFMDEEHLCARINCETTGFIEMRGYEFNYGDWDSCRNFDASKHTIPVGGFICEWEKIKPDGYNYETDSYSFPNYISLWGLNSKYYTTIFEDAPADVIVKKRLPFSNNGHCAGISYTTAAIYNGLPDVSSIYEKDFLGNKKYRSTISEIEKTDRFLIDDKEISIDDYIKYAHVYQNSADAQKAKKETMNDFDGLINKVTQYVNTDKIGVVIDIREYVQNSDGMYEQVNGHSILATGIDGNTIIVDDCNIPDSECHLEILENGEFNYDGNDWNEVNCTINYKTDIDKPYNILKTGNKVSYASDKETGETYIEGIDRVDADKNLLYVSDKNSTIICDELIEITEPDGSVNKEDISISADLLAWVPDTETITVTELKNETNEIIIAGDNTVFETNVTKDSIVSSRIGDINDLKVTTGIGDPVNISAKYINGDDEYSVNISGVASDENIVITQKNDKITLSGLTDCVINYCKKDEVVSSENIENAKGDINIEYGISEQNEGIKCEYDKIESHMCNYISKITVQPSCTNVGTMTFICDCGKSYTEEIKVMAHCDTNNDNNCDSCGEQLKQDVNTECNHLCHSKNAFLSFIWKIFNFFMRLFSMEKYCVCGAAHY